MPKRLNDQRLKNFERVAQVTDDHCGPAVLQMLLSHHKIKVKQKVVADAAKVTEKLKTHGMTIYEMAHALTIVAPSIDFWYKTDTKTEDIVKLVTQLKHPIGVEWQGIFHEYSDGIDDGHYAVVTWIDVNKDKIFLADPFQPFAYRDRKVKLSTFERRWWDNNDGIKDHRAILLLTKKDDTFPLQLGMEKL